MASFQGIRRHIFGAALRAIQNGMSTVYPSRRLIAAPAAQAALVSAGTVREFLKTQGVNASGGSSDAKAAVVRVICVRK